MNIINNRHIALLTAILCIGAFTAFIPDFKAYQLSKGMADSLITVPLGGNGWRTDKDTLGGNISNNGIANWSDKKASFIAYVRLGDTGKFKLYLNLAVPRGSSNTNSYSL